MGRDVLDPRALQAAREHLGHAGAVVARVLRERGRVIGRRLDLEEHQGRVRQARERRRQPYLLDARSRLDQAIDDAVEVSAQFGLGALEELTRDGQPRRLHRLGDQRAAGHDPEHQRGVLHRAREGADVVQRVSQGHDAVERDEAVRPLETDDAVVGRGSQDGADGLRAERHRHRARRHRGRGAGRRPAGRVGGVPRIRRRGRIAVGELCRVRLAEHDGAGRAQPRHARRVARGPRVRKRARARRRRHAGDVDDVLHADRHPVQRAERGAGAHGGIGGARRGARARVVDVDPRLHGGIDGADAVEAGVHQGGRAHLPRAEGRGRRPHTELSGAHRAPPRPPRSVRTTA